MCTTPLPSGPDAKATSAAASSASPPRRRCSSWGSVSTPPARADPSHYLSQGTLTMHSSREWLDPGGLMLARRLDQLHTSLEALGDRLRLAVAEAVAESLGGWIRDAFLTALDRLAGRPSDPEPRLLPQRRWDEPRRMTERDDQ